MFDIPVTEFYKWCPNDVDIPEFGNIVNAEAHKTNQYTTIRFGTERSPSWSYFLLSHG